MSVLYIQIRRNQITVRDLESKREVSGDAAFSNQRLLIANFFVAEKVLQDLVLQLHPRSTWHSFLPAKRMDIVVSALLPNSSAAIMSDAMLAHLIRPTVTQTMPNRRPDKALAPHPALLPNSSAAIMSDAILAHLIRPTPLVLLGAIF